MRKNKHLKYFVTAGLATIALMLIVVKSTFAASVTPDNILNDVNYIRVQNGKPALIKNNALTLAAQRKAEDMINYGYWAHFNPITGASPWMFIRNAGYRYIYAGENLARDYNDTSILMNAWMSSPTHKQNIVSGNYKETGIAMKTGVVNGESRTIIVEMFGSR